MKIYHEAPIDIFKLVQAKTDGDYCLVHLYDSNEAYRDMFKQAVAEGREVIMDNSIFELGTAFDWDAYANHIVDLKPTWFILPDVYNDASKTISNAKEFIDRYPEVLLCSNPVAVMQGATFVDAAYCYLGLNDIPEVEMIAVSMDYDWMGKGPSALANGRPWFIQALYEIGILNPHRLHHLLGVQLANEMQAYRSMPAELQKALYSVDTSNPVVHGYLGHEYEPGRGLLFKCMEPKLCDIVDNKVSEAQWNIIDKNIQEFKKLVGR